MSFRLWTWALCAAGFTGFWVWYVGGIAQHDLTWLPWWAIGSEFVTLVVAMVAARHDLLTVRRFEHEAEAAWKQLRVRADAITHQPIVGDDPAMLARRSQLYDESWAVMEPLYSDAWRPALSSFATVQRWHRQRMTALTAARTRIEEMHTELRQHRLQHLEQLHLLQRALEQMAWQYILRPVPEPQWRARSVDEHHAAQQLLKTIAEHRARDTRALLVGVEELGRKYSGPDASTAPWQLLLGDIRALDLRLNALAEEMLDDDPFVH